MTIIVILQLKYEFINVYILTQIIFLNASFDHLLL